MFSAVKNVSSLVKVTPWRNLTTELIHLRLYSCLCASSNLQYRHSSIQQNSRYAVALDKYCVKSSRITPFCTKTENSILIYQGILTPHVRMVKIFSICSSISGLAAQPILYKHAAEMGGTGVLIAVATFVGFFTFVTPVLLHLLTRKYVTDIHYNSETSVYTASLLTFFLRVKKVSFKTEDVVVPDVPGPFTSFIAKDKALFVDPRQFEDPSYYGKLMGYDKPMDFLLKKEPLTDEKKSNK
ncbi:hypothetical protein J437_LFUL006864 [Ladona fulva]|uniref:Transmembrane protein 70 n=1 Tax=Ladona fulva TaxID=123851 RepID=A0A8K0P4W5_LADFU|nr:hypothetical protein J437_LFUL006864 [Ladona fulva]